MSAPADRITLLFCRRRWNPVSWLIRWAVPRSRFALSLSSHCMIDCGDTIIEANMLHGVREVARDVALKGKTIVKQTAYQVVSREAGLAWARPVRQPDPRGRDRLDGHQPIIASPNHPLAG